MANNGKWAKLSTELNSATSRTINDAANGGPPDIIEARPEPTASAKALPIPLYNSTAPVFCLPMMMEGDRSCRLIRSAINHPNSLSQKPIQERLHRAKKLSHDM